MSFGKMNAFIDIISVETIKDNEGFGISKDTILASVRAYKEDRHGNEKWSNRAAFSEATALFCFRKIPETLRCQPRWRLHVATADTRLPI